MLPNRWILAGGTILGLAGAWLGGSALIHYFERDRDYKESVAAMQTTGNLKLFSMAMHSYHEKHNHLPPPYVLGSDGKPAHSWRVLLLEYIDQRALLMQYDFNEPWDGPNNRKLADKMPAQYRVSRDPKARGHLTSYVVLVGRKTPFPGNKQVKLADVTDGTGNTILVAEAEGFNIHWMEPRDWDVDAFPPAMGTVKTPGFSSYNRQGPSIALADGIIRMLPSGAPADLLVGMSTIAGGEEVDLKRIDK